MAKRKNSLQSIRFIAAVLVFLHHWSFFDSNTAFHNSQVFYYFSSPVTFFCILSGWTLSYTYYEKIKNKTFNLKLYFKKRLLRLYPLHIITFLFSIPIFLNWHLLPLKITVLNFFLLQAFTYSPVYLFSYNSISWCLSVFLFFYLLFPYLTSILVHFDLYIKKIAFVLMVILISVFLLWIYLTTTNPTFEYFLYYSPFARLVDFITGIFMYFVIKGIEENVKPNKLLLTCVELGAIAILVTAQWFAPKVPWKFGIDAYFIPPWAIIIGVFALSGGIISQILSWKPFVLLGSVSLEFFITHTLVLMWIYSFIGKKLSMTTIQMGIISFLITVLISFILHRILSNFFRPQLQQSTATTRK